MENLNGCYYNLLSASLCAPGERLQLCMSLDPLLSTGSDDPHAPDMHLAKMMDNVPTASLLSVKEKASYRSAKGDSLPSGEKKPQFNRSLRGNESLPVNEEPIDLFSGFKSAYEAMVSHLKYPKGATHDAIVAGAGDRGWESWLDFGEKWADKYPDNVNARFELTCLRSFLAQKYRGDNPDEVETAFKQDQFLPERQAATLMYNFGNRPNPTWSSLYGTTYQEVSNAVSKGVKLHVEMDTTKDSSDVKQTWANGSFGVGYGFFSHAGKEEEYAKLSEKVVSSRITMTLDIANYAAIPVKMSRGSWFLKSIMDMARNNPAMFRSGDTDYYKESFNKTSDPTWGDLVWFTDAIIFAKDVTMTMTIHTEFTETETEQFKQASRYGFWPFFGGKESSGWSQASVKKGSEGSVVTIGTTDKDEIHLLGTKVGYVFDM